MKLIKSPASQTIPPSRATFREKGSNKLSLKLWREPLPLSLHKEVASILNRSFCKLIQQIFFLSVVGLLPALKRSSLRGDGAQPSASEQTFEIRKIGVPVKFFKNSRRKIY